MARYISPVISEGVNLGFAGIMIIPLAVIMFITLSRAPRLKDPARVTTAYFKILLPIAILYVHMHPFENDICHRVPFHALVSQN